MGLDERRARQLEQAAVCFPILSPRQTTPPFSAPGCTTQPRRKHGHGEYVHGGEGQIAHEAES